MQYKSGDNYVPDVGGQIYHWQNFSNYVNYEYIGAGVYKHKETGEKVNYSTKGVAGSDGIAKIKIPFGQKCLIVWESGNVKGKYGQNVYEVLRDMQPIRISEIYFSELSQPTYPF